MSGTIGGYGNPTAYGYGAGPQLAPQGLFGNILGGLAGPAGGALGGLFGNQQFGSQTGNTAGQLANLLPFAAGPQMAGQQQQQPWPQMAGQQQQQLDPQFLSALINTVRQAANAVQQGMHIVNTVRQIAPGLLPLALAPDQQHQQHQQSPQQAGAMGGQQFSPQGLFGNILGGLSGNQQFGSQTGNTPGQQQQQPWPQMAGQQQQQPWPQMAGQQQQQPWSQMAGQQQLDPQFLSGLINTMRQAANAVQQGMHIVNTVRQIAPGLLPLALAPDQQHQQPQQSPQQAGAMGGQQFAPQDLSGNILGGLSGSQQSGGPSGNQQLGGQFGNTAGQLANLSFAAPQMGMSGSGYLH